MVGENATMSCFSIVKPTFTMAKQKPNIMVENDTITIYILKLSNTGIYKCLGVREDGIAFEETSHLYVTGMSLKWNYIDY